MAIIKKNLRRTRAGRDPPTLLVGMQIGAATMEKGMEVLQRLKVVLYEVTI